MRRFLALDSFDARFKADFDVGGYNSHYDEPTSSYLSLDDDIEIDSLPAEALALFAAGKRAFPQQQFPVLFAPTDVSVLLERIDSLRWDGQPIFATIRSFLQNVVENGECLGVNVVEI